MRDFMSEQTELLKQRTMRFALDVCALIKHLPHDEPGPTVKRQLAKASTGVAFNYRSSFRPASGNRAVRRAASARSPRPDATSAFTRGVPHVYGIEPPGADAGRAPAEIQPKSRVFGLGCTNRECSPRELLASDFVGV